MILENKEALRNLGIIIYSLELIEDITVEDIIEVIMEVSLKVLKASR